MTAAAARRASEKATSGPGRAGLRLIDPRALKHRARRRLIVALSFGLLAVAMFSAAFVHAQLVKGQRDLDQLREQVAQAEAERARLERDVVIASAPESIVARATALGMVRAAEPIYFNAVRLPAES